MTRSCRAALFVESIILQHLRREATLAISKVMPGGRVSPMKIQEESMAEDMLMRLTNLYSDIVSVITFDKSIEGRATGADWLWWFDTPSGAQTMLIQAKRPAEHMTHFNLRNQWTISRSTKKNWKTRKTQHQTLLDAADFLGVKPVYAIYAPVLREQWCQELYRFHGFHWPIWNTPILCNSFISIIEATTLKKTGNIPIDPLYPLDVSLVYIICCPFSNRGSRDKQNYEVFASLAPKQQTFEKLVAQVTELNQETNRIAGAIRIIITNE